MFRSTFIASIVAGSAFVSAATVHAQTIPGLVAAYGFEEGSGTTIGDLSGQNNNGVASGTTWSTAGKFGNALVFHASSVIASHSAECSIAAADYRDDARGVGVPDHGADRMARDRRQERRRLLPHGLHRQRQSPGRG